LFALLRAKALGAKVMIADMLESRLSLALSYGADSAVNVKEKDLHKEAVAFTNGNGFDVCVEACGAPATFLSCIDEAAHGENIILIGNGKKETTFLHSVLLKKELNVFGSRNALTKDFETLINLVADGKVDVMKLVSGIYKIDDAQTAFESLKNNDGTIAKLLLEF
jgi:threonine dehydrogenase-like Zn-dependent dehydrogenase